MTGEPQPFGALAAGVPAAAGPMSGPAMLAPVLPALAGVQVRLAARLSDVLQSPDDAGALASAFGAWMLSPDGIRALAYVLVVFTVGVGLEWLYWTFATSALVAVDVAPAGSPRVALVLGLRRFLLKVLGLAFFAAASIAAATGFDWSAGVQDFALTVILCVVLLRFAGMVLRLLLAPGSHGVRVMPMSQRAAARLSRGLILVVALVVIGSLVPGALERVSEQRHFAETLRLAAISLAAIVVLSSIARANRRGRRGRKRRLPPFPTRFLAGVAVLGTYLLWLGGQERAAYTLALVAGAIGCEAVLSPIVRVFWPTFGQPGAEHVFVPGLVLRTARLLVACLALAGTTAIWAPPMMAMSMDDSPSGRFAARVVGAIALILAADVAWAAVKGTIDSRLRKIGPIVIDGGEVGPNARLVTLLPLLRTAVAIVLATLLILSVLSVLGVEITPLLAGAGVVGIAVGFGAQTLVRDVLSGVFYLAEDVFRIGEYIESGASTKGTVERITLRSVALRHHNGPLHFVPYGILGAVRNNSRDWIIEKFNLPLPVDVNSDFIRKLVKGIGREMMDDPELGPLIIGPLKANLYRIDPGMKIFRCKIQTAPGKQFEVRTAAYRRIEAALKENGIPFAENATRMIVSASPGVSALAAE